MSVKTKNIGQVVGLFVGNVPPSNTALIWYDNTPNQCLHKVYNPETKLWQTLNPDIISLTTYSELVNNAKKNGLSVGNRYKIRDMDNILAIAITSTKIQYVDKLGNILIDDLGTNIQYHVISNNIIIDDVHGVINSNQQLVFSFKDETPNIENDFVLGKRKSGNNWILSKFRLNKFLSKNSGNSITWKNGFFFNFIENIKGLLDKVGGIVSYDSYEKKIKELDSAISRVSKENQGIIDNASAIINNATADKTIYDKKLPERIDTSIEPGDILKLDTLFTIISKIQRWIIKFKYATGIRISRNFSDSDGFEYVNSNDTVESAISKLQGSIKNITTKKLETVEKESVEYEGIEKNQTDFLPNDEDTNLSAFAKIRAFFKNITHNIRLTDSFEPKDYTQEVELPTKKDSLDEAYAKIVAKFNQIGIIKDGVIESNAYNTYIDYIDNELEEGEPIEKEVKRPKFLINLKKGILELFGNGLSEEDETNIKDSAKLSPSELMMSNIDRTVDYLNINHDKFKYVTDSILSEYYTEPSDSNYEYDSSSKPKTDVVFCGANEVTLSAINQSINEKGHYDAFFNKIKVGGLVLGVNNNDLAFLSMNYSTSIIKTLGNGGQITLPQNVEEGRIIFIIRDSSGYYTVHVNGSTSHKIFNGSDLVDSVTLSTDKKMIMLIFFNSFGNRSTGVWYQAQFLN